MPEKIRGAWLRVAIAICIFFGLGYQSVIAKDNLGRLFFGVDERTQMDSTRFEAGKVRSIQPQLPSAMIVNGIVFRSNGNTTVWVDGEPRKEEALPDGIRLLRDRQGKVLGLQSSTDSGDTATVRSIGEPFQRPTSGSSGLNSQ